MVFDQAGGPAYFLYDKLSADEKARAETLKNAGRKVKRLEAKQLLTDFVKTLSPNLQAIAKEQREIYEKRRDESVNKIKTLSAGAQSLYNEVKKLDNGSMDAETEHAKIKALVMAAPAGVRDELKANNIVLPGVPVVY
ncbi:unnamed protein product [Bursaphelenchus okinawaensis]|uniref:SXP/RAL-2 family protein Ani s 5-like cation-binding domain-containing protein n=1 Tax=Bursaphelenchus okinawaensis TaxID=465554 RepID=A0A811JQ59_9BILA|nr:unnamed protein product [Bursaphelenchus okinawaensis]CAG9077620.1 unnamed protein product [Bursaphelenchus okinawaensis]